MGPMLSTASAVLTPKSAQSREIGGALHFAIDQEIIAPVCFRSPLAPRLGACRKQIVGAVMRISPRTQSHPFLLCQPPAPAVFDAPDQRMLIIPRLPDIDVQ